MPQPSNAEVIYKQFIGLPDVAARAAFIRRYVADHEIETDWLDFKGCSHLKDVKESWVEKKWGKALSAFGNSGGGILIWGIDARKDPNTGKDCAGGFSLVPNPGALQTRLDQLQVTQVNPPVPGVKVHDVVDPSANNGAGFVLAYVPNSPHKPHRSEPDKHYYLRFGSHTDQPTPAVLRQMFYPTLSSNLAIRVRPGRINRGKLVRFYGSITNNGNGTARDVQIRVFANSHLSRGEPSHLPNWRSEEVTTLERQRFLLCTCVVPIHPGSTQEFLSWRFEKDGEWMRTHLTFEIYSLDAEPRACDVIFEDHEIDTGDARDAKEFPFVR